MKSDINILLLKLISCKLKYNIFEVNDRATFAYFTAQTTTTNTGNNVDVTTTELGGASVTFDGVSERFEMLDYPGGLGVFGAQAVISKTKSSDSNNYEGTFNLAIEYTNETETELEWELWMVASQDTQLNAKDTTICKLQQKQDGQKTLFWYSDASGSDLTNEKGAGCSGSAIITRLSTTLSGTKLAHGKMPHTEGEAQTITKDNLASRYSGTQDSGDLAERKINTDDPTTKYYYLIVKYPNKETTGVEGDKSQNADQGKDIKATLKIDGNPTVTLYTKSA